MLSECGVVACVVRQHDIEHFFHAAFGYADFFRTFDDVQIPESCHQSSFYSRLKKEVHTAVIVDIMIVRTMCWMIKRRITVTSGEAGITGGKSSKKSSPSTTMAPPVLHSRRDVNSFSSRLSNPIQCSSPSRLLFVGVGWSSRIIPICGRNSSTSLEACPTN